MCSACSSMKSESCAAPAGPSAGINRVFTAPGTGALAKIMTVVERTVPLSIQPRKTIRRHAKKIKQSYPPHQDDRSPDAARNPAPPRRDRRRSKTQRPTASQQARRQLDIFHERLVGKTAKRNDELIGRGSSGCWCAILAASVDDDDFDTALAKRRKRCQKRIDDAAF